MAGKGMALGAVHLISGDERVGFVLRCTKARAGNSPASHDIEIVTCLPCLQEVYVTDAGGVPHPLTCSCRYHTLARELERTPMADRRVNYPGPKDPEKAARDLLAVTTDIRFNELESSTPGTTTSTITHWRSGYDSAGASVIRCGEKNPRKFSDSNTLVTCVPCLESAYGGIGMVHDLTCICIVCQVAKRNGHAPTKNTGQKDDAGKPRYDLIPALAEEAVVKVLTFGAQKYGAENWRKVPDAHARYYAAARRHGAARRRGEYLDPESGLPHLAHEITCLMFMLELDLKTSETAEGPS